jgi:hypothetical protein
MTRWPGSLAIVESYLFFFLRCRNEPDNSQSSLADERERVSGDWKTLPAVLTRGG